MTTTLERLRDRADSLQRDITAMAGDPGEFLFLAKDACNFADLLVVMWAVIRHNLSRDGIPASILRRQCDVLLSVVDTPRKLLHTVISDWSMKNVPEEIAVLTPETVRVALHRLDTLEKEVRTVSNHAAAPPTISIDPEELKQHVQQLDDQQEWAPMK